MSEPIIRKYQKSDFNELVGSMIQLQDYLISIDPLKLLHRPPEYGERYTKNLIKKINKNEGRIFLAQLNDEIVGCIAGIIEKQSKNDLLELIPKKSGRILELIVSYKHRDKGIGKELMKHIEDYFIKKKCDFVRVEVFEPNHAAINFYQKLTYNRRITDMIKPFEKVQK
jgi:ribosomal protein S18 acetylase RimI-like enzyme